MSRPAPSRAFKRRVGARIREVREAVGLTQEKLAWELEVSKSNLSHIESGRHMPSLALLEAIASRLGVDAADLLPRRRGVALAGRLRGDNVHLARPLPELEGDVHVVIARRLPERRG